MRFTAKLTAAAVLALGAWMAPAAPALAATPAAGWTIGSFAAPTDFSAAENARCLTSKDTTFPCDRYIVTATDAGSLPTDGGEVSIADTLPAGLTAEHVQLFWSEAAGGATEELAEKFGLCTTVPVRCAIPASFFQTYGDVHPDGQLEMVVDVTVQESASQGPLTNSATVSGGGAGEATTSQQNAISPELAAFGLSGFSFQVAGLDGAPDVQAGSHPYELTTTIDLANAFNAQYGKQEDTTSVADLKDAIVDLPVGLLGSATATPTCTLAELASTEGCPANTRVGHILTQPPGNESVNGPIYNITPEHGVAAEFGFTDQLHGAHVMYASVVPGPGGYVLQISTREIPQIQLTDIVATFYGDPAERDGSGDEKVAMLTNPADCSGEALTTSIYADSWQQPGSFGAEGVPDLGDPSWASAASSSPPVTGCDELQFHPTAAVAPSTSQTASPTGLGVTLQVPQSTDPSTLATPPLKTAVVTLPAGVTVNPSSAGGLSGCTLVELGMSPTGEPSAAPPQCPESSKIGTVEVKTPLLPSTLEGSVYLASPHENPFDSLIALYVVVDDPTTGVVLKLPGKVELDSVTGQIKTIFADEPQLPFSELKLRLKQGSRAPLATPATCGTYSSTSELTPWSAPESGPPTSASEPFTITSGCAKGFAPSFSAGTPDNQAGGFSPFVTVLQRNDGEQTLSTVTMRLPPGLAGVLSKVPLCGEVQANAGSCPIASQIGHVTVQAGVGSNPVTLPEAGKPQDPVYLTGPYKGAPFGLSIVVPAEAGPFDLGTVVVRGKININPQTAQVTVETEPMPQILQGVPVDVRSVEVDIDRSGFIFNPTDCEPMSVTGTIGSAEGASAAVSSRFQAADCASLPFKPKLTASTKAKNSRKSGASLTVKIAYPKAGEANIAKVRVQLPKKLPTREETLNFACTEAQFNANPAGCPAASRVGTATAVTPVLKSPLTGPAYFVSFGHAKFPDLIAVLQAEGVTIDLAGETFISKKGITTSTFGSVPDEPVSSFALTLPEGAHSALTAQGGNLCEDKLVMPTQITGQNGALIQQSTTIAVQGCSKKLALAGHKVKGREAKVSVYVPAAGKLTFSGKGLAGKSKTATGRGTVSVELSEKKAGKLRTTVTVAFKPKKGKKQTKELKLDFKK